MFEHAKRYFANVQMFRMVGWLGMGVFFYAASISVGTDRPQVQLALWKLGNVTMFAFVGYWIARRAIGRLRAIYDGKYANSEALIISASILARAIVIGASILAANGL